MNEDIEELACLYVLDQLDAPQRAAFEARLLREPELATFVRELEATLSLSIRALPQSLPSSTALAHIEARLPGRLSAREFPPYSPPPAAFNWAACAKWGLAALVALSLTTIAVQSLRHTASPAVIFFVGLESNGNTFADLPVGGSAKDSDARFMQLASLAEKFWEKPGQLPIKSMLSPSDSRGYALFDPSSMQGFVAVEQLPTITEAQRYHLWLLDPASGRISDAGVLPLGHTKSGLYSFALGKTKDAQSTRPQIFITVEDVGSETSATPGQPRGKVILGDRRI